MNERVKELRKALDLSGEKFGERLGISRFAISQIETGRNSLTNQMIKLICLTYNVNENWLRNGNGEMFNTSSDDFITNIRKQYNLTDFQVNIVKTYLNLTDKERLVIDKFITSCQENPNNIEI